jgi:hypothetical protein
MQRYDGPNGMLYTSLISLAYGHVQCLLRLVRILWVRGVGQLLARYFTDCG